MSYGLEVLDRIDVGNDPVNWVDPWGLESSLRDSTVKAFGLLLHLAGAVRYPAAPPCPENAVAALFDEAMNSVSSEEELAMSTLPLAGLRKKPGKLGQFKGTDALRAENKVLRDAAKKAGVTKEQQRILHDEVSGQGLTYKKMVEIAKDIKKGNY